MKTIVCVATIAGCLAFSCLTVLSCSSPDSIIAEPQVDYLEAVRGWLVSVQQPSGLVISREGLENSDWAVSLYDQSLSAMAFLCFGETERARRILDVFAGRQDELETGLGGFYQFRRVSGEANTGTNRWLGDNAYLLAALYNYAAITGDSSSYESLRAKLEEWITGLQQADSGGLISGTLPGGTEYSTIIVEGNIDAFGAVPGYTDFHRGILRYFKEQRWDDANRVLVAWPNPPKSSWRYACDNIAWGVCAIENLPSSFAFAERTFALTDSSAANGNLSAGFCFDGDKDTIHPEGTLGMVAAYQAAGLDARALYYLAETEKLMVPGIVDGETFGLPYSSGPGTSFGGEVFTQVHYDRPWVSSSAWYIFVRKGFNPFGYARNRDIPPEDAF